MALPYDHLLFAALRQGKQEDARKALRFRQITGTRRSYADPDVLSLARLAYDERFRPWRARLTRRYLGWFGDSAQISGITRVFRTAVPWSDIPESQVALGELLRTRAGADSMLRASIHEGKAIGFMALGRSHQALAHADSAAAIWGSDMADLERAEWRVVLRALGLPIADSGDWQARLQVLARDSALAPRAAWALGLAAYAAGDTTEGRRWTTRLATGTGNQALERYLSALALAARREWHAAISLADSLETAFNVADPPDPFARAVFHLQRGAWFTAVGDRRGADREWRWYEASDIDGWPHGPAQAGEVDGMLGVYARLIRSEAQLHPKAEVALRTRGCAHVRRVVELWDEADETFQELKERADSLLHTCAG
jgi:hypothetical protein